MSAPTGPGSTGRVLKRAPLVLGMQGLSRIRKNTAYFKVNYLLVMLTTCAVTLVMNPSSLLVLALLMAAWLYMLFIRTQPVVLWGRQLR